MMDIPQAQDFLRTHHRAVLATRRANGEPQLSPVAVGVDGEGRPVISTRETAMKTGNLRRDSRASLCVMSDEFYGDWIQIDGTIEVVSLPDAMEMLVEYYRQLAGEHPDWDEYRSAMERERRVMLRMRIERAGPDRSG